MSNPITSTIVAIATPPGEGAIGIIRLSGPEAIGIADVIFKGKRLAAQASHTIHFGRIVDNTQSDATVDEVVVSLYKNPRSYTGEDVVEISCHGSHYILQRIVAICVANGALVAGPGEFTLRAFLHGRLDLTQAEAVADLIATEGAAAHQAALHNLRGGFRDDLTQLREDLIRFSALIELELDFSGEDVEFADRTQLRNLLNDSIGKVGSLVASFRLGNAVKNGIRVAIIGKPNAGKSTLLNALLNEERAIVSDIAGTTRDTIEETLNIGGILFRLIDTAGIRSGAVDRIEEIGIERSYRNAEGADLVIHLLDLSAAGYEDAEVEGWLVEKGKQLLRVYNKSDVRSAGAAADGAVPAGLFISAKRGEGIEELKNQMYSLAIGNELQADATIVTNARHHAALQQVLQSLQDVLYGMDSGLPGDLLALDIRRCLHFIGEITGAVTTEDQLDFIFSKFCIGK